MTVGRDGHVYLTSESNGKGFCLRIARDGSSKLGGEVVYAIHNGTANKDGVIATANAHFNHSLNLYDAQFNKLNASDDFLVNDQVGWDAPLHVEAGSQSSEFYGLDQHRNRVVRVGVDGKVKAVFTVRPEHVDDWGKPRTFRVSEPLQSFFFLTATELVRTKLDGTLLWRVAIPVRYSWDGNSYGGFDVADDGTTYFVEGASDVLKRLSPDGKPLPELKLSRADDSLKASSTSPITSVRVFGNDLVLRRRSPTELFQTYDLETGKLKHVESIAHERLTVTFPSVVWTNGEKLPVKISFNGGLSTVSNGTDATNGTDEKDIRPSSAIRPNDSLPQRLQQSPRFRIWMTPFGISDWQELERDAESNIVVPADYAGLYQLKVSPEVTPRQTAEPSEYVVREIIEVRKPNSRGTIAVVTPLNRSHYQAQEDIVGRVIQRVKALHAVSKVEVRVREVETNKVIMTREVDLTPSLDQPDLAVGKFELSPPYYESRRKLFCVEVDVADLTCVGQRIAIGQYKSDWLAPFYSFRTTLYGDYGITFPQRNAWESADAAVAHGDRMKKLGFNQFVNRANWQLGLDFANDDNGRGLLNRVKERLQKDPLAVTPEKAEFGSAHHQIAEVYSANNWRELLLLVNMDGGLPIGTGFDSRKPAQFAETIKRYTEALRSYPAFGGWTWVANWWLFDANAKFKTPDEKPKYEAALKVARETGKWDPILDQIEDRKFQFAVDAQAMFKKQLSDLRKTPGVPEREELDDDNEALSRFVTAGAGPYRRPEVLNDINFSNVDEIDIQYQAEQITTPDWLHHAVDNSTTFGKAAWTHPELWNDFGTGEQILPMSWLALMRGAGGIGTAGTVPNWPNVPMDSRGGYHGTTSVFRALNRLTVPHRFGDIFAAWGAGRREGLADDDRIGIIVSPRQVKIETFCNGLGSLTFSRQFEAYQSFLYANCVARFVTLDEIKEKVDGPIKKFLLTPASPALGQRFDALLLVGQTVELEPEWIDYLKRARAAGIRVFVDGTTRRDIYPEAEDLKLHFDFVEKEHSANNDHAFYTYPARFISNANALAPLVNELKAKSKRPKDIVTIRSLTLRVEPDVGTNGATEKLTQFDSASPTARLGESSYGLSPKLQPIRPVVLIREMADAAAEKDEGRLVFVVNNTPTMLEPGQLRRVGRAISTRTPVLAHLKFDLAPGQIVLDMFAWRIVEPECIADLRDTYGRLYFVGAKEAVQGMLKTGTEFDELLHKTGHDTRDDRALQHRNFGPHLRDVAVSTDGKTALLNAFNWDDNLYYIDLETGRELPPHRVLAQGRIGDHFAYAPKATKAGFFVQGFDLNSAEGYQLYSLTRSQALPGNARVEALPRGSASETAQSQPKPETRGRASEAAFPGGAWERVSVDRRFALPALPGCLTGWAFTAWIQDRVNNFAVPQSGKWVAGSGNLGIAVWDRDGKLLWSDDWSREKRQTCLIEALDDETLLIAEGLKLRAVSAFAGRSLTLRVEQQQQQQQTTAKTLDSESQATARDTQHWQLTLADTGEVLGLHVSRDGKTVAVRTSTSGGTVFVIRDGKLLAKLQTAADDLSMSDDGALIAVTTGHQLRVFQLGPMGLGPMGRMRPMREEKTIVIQKGASDDSADAGAKTIRPSGPISPTPISPINPIAAIPLSWLAHGDDQLRFPRVSSDGKRIAVSSELGTVYVFSDEGRKLHERDEFSICVPAWLPNDDLLLASWMGAVVRVDVEFKTLWRTHVRDGDELSGGTRTRSQAPLGNGPAEALLPGASGTQTSEPQNRTGSGASNAAFPSRAWERVRSGVRSELPTSRVTSWIAAESTLTDKKNLLAPNQFIAKLMLGDFAATPQRNLNELVDGKWELRSTRSQALLGNGPTEALHPETNGGAGRIVDEKAQNRTGSGASNAAFPSRAWERVKETAKSGHPTESVWLDWRDHGMIESGWRGEFALVLDSFNKQLRVDSLTFVEDAEHPESWLRDMKLEYWNADAEKWVFAEYLTSDSAVHHHKLKKPVEAARFRFVKADGHAWPAGNVRLQEVMLHGEVIGASHPDVVAKRPIAVLFDENVASVKGTYEHGHNAGLKFATGSEAFSGGNYITLPGDKNYSALWQPPFGHMTPNWWFEVVEKPEPGQYRFLQFSVKALAPETKGITLRVAPNHYGGIAAHVGEASKSDGAVLHQASGAVPFEWHTVTIDLWELLPENQRGKPFNIGAMSLGTVGGPAAIDRIRLGRTRESLDGK